MIVDGKEYHTFGYWSTFGYKIIKGSKARWFGEVARFSEDQVIKRPKNCQPKIPRKYSWMEGLDHEEIGQFTGEYGNPYW